MAIKDTAYASLFDKKDLPYVRLLAEEITAIHNQDLINEFNNTLENKWNDHNPIIEIGNKQIELLQVSKADDLVLTLGINKCIDLILANASITDRWQYIFTGTGTTPPTIADTALATPIIGGGSVDISFTGNGWREYAGTSMRIAAVFGESSPSNTITESGVRNAAGVYLNRNVFSNNPITHIINISAFVISCVIEFVPVM